MKQDYAILEELLDVIEQLRQRSGSSTDQGRPPLFKRLRSDLMKYRQEIKNDSLKGPARQRRSCELFRRILRQYPSDRKESH